MIKIETAIANVLANAGNSDDRALAKSIAEVLYAYSENNPNALIFGRSVEDFTKLLVTVSFEYQGILMNNIGSGVSQEIRDRYFTIGKNHYNNPPAEVVGVTGEWFSSK